MIDRIIKKKREEIQGLKSQTSLDELKKIIKHVPKEGSFKNTITKNNDIGLIAELKKASASKGVLRKDFNPVEITRIYEKEGVDAISVLTEKDFFMGSLDYVPLLKKETNLPILQKDFFIDEYQIYYAAYLGADAILLISSILSKKELLDYMSIARQFNLDVLVEVHDEADLTKALSVNPEIIGINNRNLRTFKVDIHNTSRLISLIPRSKELTIVSESGIEFYEDVLDLKRLGVDAVLIGEAFMREEDISKKIRQIKGLDK